MTAVEISSEGPVFSRKGEPKALFSAPGPRTQGWFYNYDVAPNRRFLFNKIVQSSSPPATTVIANWQALLK